MSKPELDLRPRSPEEISAIIQRAVKEQWRELAIVKGERVLVDHFSHQWRMHTESPHFFVSESKLSNNDIDAISQLIAADQLWLIGLQLPAAGARALAQLQNLRFWSWARPPLTEKSKPWRLQCFDHRNFGTTF